MRALYKVPPLACLEVLLWRLVVLESAVLPGARSQSGPRPHRAQGSNEPGSKGTYCVLRSGELQASHCALRGYTGRRGTTALGVLQIQWDEFYCRILYCM